ncbi:MAG: DUF2207 domain-containing protein [Flavobacteriales bacterium]|nr:DUF2207 domain-containing protein [Flavobacteriales bacterium]
MKFKKILLYLLLSITFVQGQGKSYKILSTNIESNILKEGIVEIQETRVFSFKGDYSFVYRDIRKKGYDQLYDIQVFEGDKPYLNTETEEEGNFRIESRDKYYRIYWYHSSIDEDKTFILKYKLKNPFTVGKTDAQFRWVYLDDKFDKRPGKLNFTQNLDGDIDTNTLYYSVEQPIRSKKYESSVKENGLFELYSDTFTGNTVLQLRTIFPKSYLSISSINNEQFSLAGLLLEEKNQRTASYGVIAMALLSLLFGITFYRRYLKEHHIPIDENQSFAEFPSKHHPVLIGWLIWRYPSVSPFGILATLFELASKKKVHLETVESGKWIFKSKKLKVDVINPDTSDLSNSFSKLLLDRILTIGTNTYFSKIWQKYSFSNSKWNKNRTKEIKKLEWLDTSGDQERRTAISLEIVLFVSMIGLGIFYKTFWALLSIIPFTLFIIIVMGSRLSEKGRELHLMWHAFGDALQENKLNIQDFDPDLLLQYCIIMGMQGEKLKHVIDQAHEGGHAYMWYGGGTPSDVSSITAGITDIATTGTAISASYGGDGGGGAGGGGAGGGGGGGAG